MQILADTPEDVSVKAPADPPLNADGEVTVEAVEARAEWRIRAELADKARDLGAEAKALKHSFGTVVDTDYLGNLNDLVRNMEEAVQNGEERYDFLV